MAETILRDIRRDLATVAIQHAALSKRLAAIEQQIRTLTQAREVA